MVLGHAKFLRNNGRSTFFLLLLSFMFIGWVIYLKVQRYNLFLNLDDNFDNTSLPDKNDVVDDIIQYKVEQVSMRNDIIHTNNVSRGIPIKPFQYNPLLVIVIQAHTGYRLESLISSLEKVTGINNTLTIFANDYYDTLIEGVKLSNYIQIYYPYTIGLYPDMFPGDDNNFCDKDQCTPSRGRRDAWLVQEKHFWWWLMNYVFEQSYLLEHYAGYVLLLRYDQIVAEDLLYMFKTLRRFLVKKCPQCEMLSLGAHNPNVSSFDAIYGDLVITPFGTTDNNYGIAFNRSTWNKIKDLKDSFCSFNDYRWDESIKYLGTKFPSRKIMMISPKGARVVSTNCKEYLDSEIYVKTAESFLKSVKRGFFPLKIRVAKSDGFVNITEMKNWEDIRDIEFCLFMADPNFCRFMGQIGMGC